MHTKLGVVLFMMTIFECYGHLPILGDIISAAHDRVHSTVEGVAGAVLGGFNLNFGGHLGFNKQARPQHVPEKNSEETVIVVVEEDNGNDYYRPPNNNNYKPVHHGHRPHHRPRPGYDDHNQDTYNQNERDYQQNPGNQGNDNKYYGNNNQNGHPTNNNENYNNNGHVNNQFNQNNPTRPVENQENPNQNPYNNGNIDQVNNNPSTESIKTTVFVEPSVLPNDDVKNKVTDKPSEDIPLFIPLNPEEYVYGGDNINITAPKRDTEKTKQAEAEDEDFAIDIRFKDQ